MVPIRLFDGVWCLFFLAQGKQSGNYVLQYSEVKVREIVINRHIWDAIELFGELEYSVSFFFLPSNERVNLIPLPVSTIKLHQLLL